MLLQICEPDAGLNTSSTQCAVGIDLGTTHTVVAYSISGQVRVLPLEDNHNPLVPSVVAYTEGVYKVGHHAVDILQQRPHEGVSSIKRLMGRSSAQMKDVPAHYTLYEDPLDPHALKVQLGGVALTPSQVSAQILSFVKHQAAVLLGQSVTHAVITVPAYFDDGARHATREAAQSAGFQVLRLLNEPTAAALAYGLDQALEGCYVVYDLGGGTFDISILKLTQGVFQVLATGGDTLLGGDDFDHALLNHWYHQEPLPALTDQDVRRCLPWVRQAREILSYQSTVTCKIPWTLSETSVAHDYTCDQSTLETLIKPYVMRTLSVCRRVLHDSGLDLTDIQGVVLVGGATRTPLVRQSVSDFFRCPMHQELNPDAVVAIGAALQADRLTHGGHALLLDVAPLSLGVETMGKLVDVVIPRNTPIPIRQAQWYTTYKDNQTALSIHVVQGESESVLACRSLGQFELHGIPPMPAGQARIQVVFEVDADGVLMVTAQEQGTGQAQTIHMRPYEGLSFDSVVDLLQKGSEHHTTMNLT